VSLADLQGLGYTAATARQAIASGQMDVDSATLAEIDAALGGTTPYSGAGGAGIGLPQGGNQAAAAPATASTLTGWVTPATPVPDAAATGAKATLAAMLGQFGPGMAALAGPAYDLQTTGVTDTTAILLALENTQEFRAAMPGIRDATTGQLIMTPAAYMTYANTVRSAFADAGVAPPDAATIGSYVQQRKSATELNTELGAYKELKENPFISDHFAAITGTNPGPEGIFALLTGQAPDLEAMYQQSVAQGVDQQTYAARLAALPSGAGRTSADIMNALQANPDTFFNQATPSLNRMDMTVALQRAVADNAAEYKGGGQSLVNQKAITQTF
jgi:hypothetical protein